jgi:hypothetical protein
MRAFAAIVVTILSASAAMAGETTRCAPIETVPGVKIRPATCPPEDAAKTGSIKSSEPLPAGSRPNFMKFGNTEVRIGGRVRIEGGYVSQP